MKVLIVDDELWSRQLIKKVIDWPFYGFNELIEASNGEEAIAVLEQKSISLMITDMRMPKMDGAALMQYVRTKDYPTEIIVMSGYEDYNYLHEALKTKAIDYLLKPVVKEELQQAVARALDIITENNSYLYIEEILRHEDLKLELNKYYEMKNMMYKALINIDEEQLIQELNKLESLLKEKTIHQQLAHFILTDIHRFLIRLQKEYAIESKINYQIETFTLATLQDDLLRILETIRNKEVYKKIQILDVQKYIDNHFTESITLTDIADSYHVSKEHLSRLFKKQVGMSVQQYITSKKISYAKGLLKKHQALSISTVSVMSGYIDLQYFYRVFRKETGMTPIQYKNANINIIQ